MSVKWRKILFDCLKYVVAAVLGGLGVGLSGCVCVPEFMF